jgi:hypothetical protein
VRITTSGHYVLFIGGTPYEGIPNALGELAREKRSLMMWRISTWTPPP